MATISQHSRVSDQYYKEAVDNSALFNLRMKIERKMRQPFLDSQTGVAQNHSNLHVPYRYRCSGEKCLYVTHQHTISHIAHVPKVNKIPPKYHNNN